MFGAAVTGAGGAAVTTSVTGIAWDRLHAPAPVSVTIPEYEPAASEAGFTDTISWLLTPFGTAVASQFPALDAAA